MKHMKNDGIGYISGRGVSKYWGVSKQLTPSVGPDPWVVKFADTYVPVGKTDRYRMFTAQGFTLKEVDAAKIAVYFHENIVPFCNHPAKLEFESVDGKRILTVDTRKKVITSTSKSVAIDTLSADKVSVQPMKKDFYTPPSMLADILATDVAAEKAQVVVEETEYQKGFAAGFALNEIIRSKLGEKGLQSVLEAVQKRLKEKSV